MINALLIESERHFWENFCDAFSLIIKNSSNQTSLEKNLKTQELILPITLNSFFNNN